MDTAFVITGKSKQAEYLRDYIASLPYVKLIPIDDPLPKAKLKEKVAQAFREIEAHKTGTHKLKSFREIVDEC